MLFNWFYFVKPLDLSGPIDYSLGVVRDSP